MHKYGLSDIVFILVWIGMMYWPHSVLGAPSIGAGAAAPEIASGVREYNLTLFMRDVVLKNPNASVSGFVDMKPGLAFLEPVLLDLWYSCTPTIRTDLSSLSISVNGVPVASRHLQPNVFFKENWRVPLPVSHFKPGSNEITISVLHRSIDGLCRDIDNEGNWFIIRPETAIRFQTGFKQYKLSDAPHPFVNEYLAAKMNTAIFMPDVNASTIAVMLKMASGWGGQASPGAPMRLTVEPGRPGLAAAANEVCLGLADAWVLAAGGAYPDDSAILRLQSLNDGYQRLYVSGSNERGLALAGEALTRDAFIKTLSGNETVFANSFGEPMLQLTTAKRGRYTLKDLGFEGDVEVAGAFHQEAEFYLPRPANYDIGEDSYVELHFRHSKILDPKKSAVTVYINDKPIRSAVLMAENADSGVLKVPIPDGELYQPGWRIRFAFYHDLGIIDCSKRYDDVAWSVVEKESNVYLAPGKRGRVLSLDDFPYRFNTDQNGMLPLTMWLSPNPTPEELTLACKLAYWIGQVNQGKIAWQVALSPSFSVEQAPGSVIVLASNAALHERSALDGLLPIFPDAAGAFRSESWIDAAPDVFRTKDVYQAVKSGGSKSTIVYAFSYADVKSMDRYLNLLLNSGAVLDGQAAFCDASGQMVVYTKPGGAQDTSGSIVDNIFSSAAGLYIVILLAVVLGTAGLMVYLKRRP